LLLVLAVTLDLAAGGAAFAKKPPRCPDSTYLIAEAAAGAPVIADSVTIKGSTVALGPSCPLRKGVVVGTKQGTSVRVRWRRCGELKKVALRALIDKSCTTMSGTVRAKGVKSQTVHGAPPPDTTTTTTTLAPSTTTTTPGSATTTTTVPSRTCDQSDRDQLEA